MQQAYVFRKAAAFHVTEATNDTPRPRLMSLPCNM